jgi:hypothetical protein
MTAMRGDDPQSSQWAHEPAEPRARERGKPLVGGNERASLAHRECEIEAIVQRVIELDGELRGGREQFNDRHDRDSLSQKSLTSS